MDLDRIRALDLRSPGSVWAAIAQMQAEARGEWIVWDEIVWDWPE